MLCQQVFGSVLARQREGLEGDLHHRDCGHVLYFDIVLYAQDGLQRSRSVNNKQMPMDLMQQLAGRLSEYAEVGDMDRECPHTLSC